MKKMFALALALMLCVSVMSVAAFAAGDTITIRVFMDVDSAPNAWAWGDYGNAFSVWPGEPMVKNGSCWEIKVPVGTTGFLVNNGSAQTSDMWLVGTVDAEIKVAADFSSFEIIKGGIVPDGFYVAGSAALCGSDWDCNDPNNKMTRGDDGIYRKVYKNVAVGDYEFKITDGTWENYWPEENVVFHLDEVTDITIIFDTARECVTVKAGGEPEANYYVAGVKALCGSEWDPADPNNKMTRGDDGIYRKIYKNLAAGQYSFKVTDGTWERIWGGYGENGNYEFRIAVPSDVVVEFHPASGKLDVVMIMDKVNSYYVAGVKALCGSEWDPADPNNKMTKGDDGIYRKTYKNLAAGQYSFAITDGTWSRFWGGNDENGNYVFELTSLSDVTIEFNPSTGKIDILITKVNGYSYYVAGNKELTGFDWKVDGIEMVKGDDGLYTYTFKNVPAGRHSLKVTQGDWNKPSWGHTGENGNYDFELNKISDVTVIFNAEKGLIMLDMSGKEPPPTGDVSLTAVSVALLAATAGLVVLISKKKKF